MRIKTKLILTILVFLLFANFDANAQGFKKKNSSSSSSSSSSSTDENKSESTNNTEKKNSDSNNKTESTQGSEKKNSDSKNKSNTSEKNNNKATDFEDIDKSDKKSTKDKNKDKKSSKDKDKEKKSSKDKNKDKDKEAEKEENGNLILNPGFEDTDNAKLKKLNSIDKTKEWFSPTGLKADLYSAIPKDPFVNAEGNKYGKEKPSEGNHNVGLVMYSYRDKDTRTYIMTQLKEELIKGENYCVSFDLSLSDLSKYACNDIGVHFTSKPFEIETKSNILLDPKKDEILYSDDNKIFNKTFSYEQFCVEYEAKGGEEFMILGNFSESKNTKFARMRLSKDIKGTQVPIAYYYIDNVTLKVAENGCECNKGLMSEEVERFVYSKNLSISGDVELTFEELIDAATVYFAYLQEEIPSTNKKELDILAKSLLENKSKKLNIKGHLTNEEFVESKNNPKYSNLSLQRAINVRDYLVSKGVEKSRLEVNDMLNNEVIGGKDKLSEAKSRRVNFIAK